MSGDLAAFYRARLDEDERELVKDPPKGLGYASLGARMRREVEAGRALLAEYETAAALCGEGAKYDRELAGWQAGRLLQMQRVIRILAAIHSGHPDYRAGRKP